MTTTVNSTLKDVFAQWNSVFNDLEKQKEVITPISFGGEDPLALSWACYNNWMENGLSRFMAFSDIKPADQDYELAQATRTYYRDKMAFKALRGTPLTKFQSALYSMLGSSEYTSDQVGMLYKLPYFYTEDVSHDRVFEKTKNLETFLSQGTFQIRTIIPVERIFVSRRSSERYEYWFCDEKQNGACIVVAANNPIRSFIDAVWRKPGTTNIGGNWFIKSLQFKPDYHYWMIGNPELA